MNMHRGRDFTSSLYLGFYHPSYEIGTWDRLSLGKPAALEEPELAKSLGNEIAKLQGQEAGILAPSTLHLFFDVFYQLGKHNPAILYDQELYAVGKWGLNSINPNLKLARPFSHLDYISLGKVVNRYVPKNRQIVLVTDGLCPVCGRTPPLKEYLKIIRPFGGLILIDDTQAFGILGKNPCPSKPFGQKGGGILRYLNIPSPQILIISSLAKGFGVPIAALSGSAYWIRQFRQRSLTRFHNSPASLPQLLATQNACKLNGTLGGRRRLHLSNLINYFQRFMRKMQIPYSTQHFPVQNLIELRRGEAASLHRFLLDKGIKSLLTNYSCSYPNRLNNTFIFRADHSLQDIEHVGYTIAKYKKHINKLS